MSPKPSQGDMHSAVRWRRGFRSVQWTLAYAYGSSALSALLVAYGVYVINDRWLHVQGGWLKALLVGIVFIGLPLRATWSGYAYGRDLKRRALVLQSTAEAMLGGTMHSEETHAEKLTDEIDQVRAVWNDVAHRLTQQVAAMQRLINRNQELLEKSSRVAVLEERQRLARDLHDSVSQQLFAVSLSAATLVKQFERALDRTTHAEERSGEAERAQLLALLRRCEELEELSSQAQREMRALILHLRPIDLQGKSLAVALEEFLTEVESRMPLQYRWNIGELGSLEPGIEDQLFRIVQEALSNALRHADARRIDLYLHRDGANIHFQLEDDGRGFDSSDRRVTSYGLDTMRERAEQLGGRLTITSATGIGTRLFVNIPVVEQA